MSWSGEVLALANRASVQPDPVHDRLHDAAVQDAFDPARRLKVCSHRLRGLITRLRRASESSARARTSSRRPHDSRRQPPSVARPGRHNRSVVDIGASKIALRVGSKRYYEGLRGFGLSGPTWDPAAGWPGPQAAWHASPAGGRHPRQGNGLQCSKRCLGRGDLMDRGGTASGGGSRNAALGSGMTWTRVDSVSQLSSMRPRPALQRGPPGPRGTSPRPVPATARPGPARAHQRTDPGTDPGQREKGGRRSLRAVGQRWSPGSRRFPGQAWQRNGACGRLWHGREAEPGQWNRASSGSGPGRDPIGSARSPVGGWAAPR